MNWLKIIKLWDVDEYKEYIREVILEEFVRLIPSSGRVIHYKRRKYVCTVCGCSTMPSLGSGRDVIRDHIMDEHFQRVGVIEDTLIKRRPHHLKPWKDPDSLFCDTKFLEKLLGKEPAKSLECRDMGESRNGS